MALAQTGHPTAMAALREEGWHLRPCQAARVGWSVSIICSVNILGEENSCCLYSGFDSDV